MDDAATSTQGAAPGQVLIAEGMASDRFYCVEAGEVEVTQGGRVLRHEGPGEFFGEIGLLRDVPRTATVTAVGEVTLQSLSREGLPRSSGPRPDGPRTRQRHRHQTAGHMSTKGSGRGPS